MSADADDAVRSLWCEVRCGGSCCCGMMVIGGHVGDTIDRRCCALTTSRSAARFGRTRGRSLGFRLLRFEPR